MDLKTNPNLLQRPSAKELLQHRFVKYARKTSQLTELTERHQEWRSKVPSKKGKDAARAKDETVVVGTMMSAWEFETVRSGGGETYRSTKFATVWRSALSEMCTSADDFLQQPVPDDPELAALDSGGEEPSIASLLIAAGELPSIPTEKSLRPPALSGHRHRNSWQARHDINGTVVRPADVGTGCALLALRS